MGVKLRQGALTDLAYLIFNPLVTKTVAKGAAFATLIFLAVMSGVPVGGGALREYITHRHSVFGTLPKPAQIFLLLFFSDGVAYWAHRIFHRGKLWRIHAIHHSAKNLDWLASVRVHPLNDIIARMLQVIPFFFLGFSPTLLKGFLPFLVLYAVFIHANLTWDFGSFRMILASPRFHRWHYTSQEEGLDKNFAGMFPFWDWLFGTLYMPKDAVPRKFGVVPDDVPEGFIGQLFCPFQSRENSN